MEGYAMTTGDMERGLENSLVDSGPVYKTTVTAVAERKASRGWLWRLCGVLLIAALCAAAALLFAWCQHGRLATMQDGMEPQLEIFIGAKDTHNTLKQIASNAKAAIHLEGEYNPNLTTDTVQWRKDVGQAFSQGGFKLQGNQILIPHTGLFFVYSQASFRVKCNGPGERTTPLSHVIWRYSDSIGDNGNLLSGVRSVCQQNYGNAESNIGEGWYNAVYLSAVFQLNEGDKLWTETNRLTDVEPEQGKNFFGVFAL
ncbi:tumor necrosis factor-like [Oncorhynchus kisutch]|uniref:Lymphotoxin-alpha n=1 Tax=Oncorhynchus kisutch TaxID=8019 RepID=A0A8C7J3Z9_ONCKI|nr:tumor necrosis factor-like [Oncorhynchus kisutch]